MSALFQPARITHLTVAAALVLAGVGAMPYAGSWNDGSRLAAVESLLERGTLSIDDSVFVRPAAAPADHPPYPPGLLRQCGSLDKLFIRGRFYSDKPPVVSCLLALLYAPGRAAGLLPSPAERPDLFAQLMTLFTSLLAYAVSLGCLHRIGEAVGLKGWMRALWMAAFALSTFALAYTRHVNNHVLQLAVTTAWLLLAMRTGECDGLSRPWLSLLGMGCLLGFGYNLDLGSGPLLLAVGVGLVGWRTRGLVPMMAVAAAALPWVVACHALNYAIGGVVGPLNAVPAYLAWPGSPFDTGNMTGVLRPTPGKQAVYALALLFGKHGVLVHNLPLLLGLPAMAVLLRPSRYRAEALAGLLWCAMTWGLYSLASNNYSGACCSVRWFVPFLSPGFLLLAVYLKHHPERVRDLTALAAWGAVLGVLMWCVGPWTTRMVPALWPVVGCALVTWLVVRLWPRRGAAPAVLPEVEAVEEPATPRMAA
jgi:hypothetical protein